MVILASELGRTDGFYPFGNSLVPLDTWNLVFSEEAFWSVLAQGSLGPISEMCSVFRNRNFPSISIEQLRAIAIGCVFREYVGQPWKTTPKRASCVWC